MKSLLTFIAGVCVGFIVALYYEVLSKPALPSEHWCDWFDPAYLEALENLDRLDTLADTQPVKVLDEVGAWELDEWTRLVNE